jgi:hypothetical protein
MQRSSHIGRRTSVTTIPRLDEEALSFDSGGYMVPLTPEEIAKLRQKLADLDISDESKDELILLIDSIAISLV